MTEQDYYITKYVDVIKQHASFLTIKGFIITEISEYTIIYSNNNCKIGIYYGRYSDEPDISVRFENHGMPPEEYSIGWFRVLKGGVFPYKKSEEEKDKLSEIFSLLTYLKSNINDVTNINFCRNAQNKINENFEKNIW